MKVMIVLSSPHVIRGLSQLINDLVCTTEETLKLLDCRSAIYKSLAGNRLEAGAETTAPAIHTFIGAMVSSPDVQKRARAQLASVCGNCLPEIDDFDRLPYIRCTMEQTLH
jgi:hypothetical protein